MEVLFCSATFSFDPLLALGDAAIRRACWGVFSLGTSFYGNDRAKFRDKPVIIRCRFPSRITIASSLNGGSGLTGKSGRKTANACDSNAIEMRTETTAHFILAAKNTFTEALASWRNRAVSVRNRTCCEFVQLKVL
jgi:hypothetical protein